MMRKFLLIITVACGMLACKKGSSVSPVFFGKWELRKAYGGLLGFDSTYKAGNGNIYQFNSDSTYKRFSENKLNAQGIYHIKRFINPSVPPTNSGSSSVIFFDNNSSGEPLILNGTMLSIGTTIADGIEEDYQKIQN